MNQNSLEHDTLEEFKDEGLKEIPKDKLPKPIVPDKPEPLLTIKREEMRDKINITKAEKWCVPTNPFIWEGDVEDLYED